MIRISNLNKQFGQQILFSDVNVAIYENEKIGLIGRNGAGKSTFLKILEEQDTTDCEIDINKSVIIRSLEQNLNFDYPTILEQVISSLRAEDDSQNWKAEAILLGLGFSKNDFKKAPKEFSSGFQIRIRLAEALVADSDLLILDEPTNYLDIISLRWLANFLQNWKKGFILVTHDRNFMEKVVTHVIGIHRCKMRKMAGGPKKLLDQIALEENVYEKTRQNQIKKKEKTEEFIRKFRAGARSAGLVQSRIKALEKQDIGEALENIPQIRFKFHYKPYEGDSLIKLDELNFGYTEDDQIIKNLSLETLAGDKIAIIGKNGRGKSTLLKLIAGHLSPISGKVKVNPSLSIGYFGQDSKDELDPNKSVLEEFVAIPHINEQEARRMCSMLLFDAESVKKKINYLSGGEKNRVCLGKAILDTTQILILDEPTNHLDLESAQALIQAIQEFKGLVIFVTHDEYMIETVANRLVVFDDGVQTVINENYAYFLKNRGWSDELNLITQTMNPGEIIRNQSKINQNLLRQIQKQQAALEKKIAKLEQTEIENGKLLQDACFEKDHQKIKTYGEKAKQIHDEIATLYAEFEDLIVQEDKIKNS